ncbi:MULTISPECIES: hypothetical protein [Sinorhizobium]|uniref:hypothetical protein n=1 Tax=Sinorhizobium TaxID=28105 RepID=UPI001185D688|nr:MULTISPECIES: hypothetical protein [Sinorhizobium]
MADDDIALTERNPVTRCNPSFRNYRGHFPGQCRVLDEPPFSEGACAGGIGRKRRACAAKHWFFYVLTTKTCNF